MDDPAGLLDYIRANPEDLAARRAYADWMEEQGEAGLAEMARVGLELRELGVNESRWAPLERRYRKLLEHATQRELAHPWGGSVGWCCVHGVYSGILDEVRLGGDGGIRAFLPIADATLRRHPGLLLTVLPYVPGWNVDVRNVRPWTGEAVGELLAAPFVARLRHLKFDFPDTTRLAKALTRAPLSRLRSLDLELGDNELTDKAAFALAGNPRLAGLVRLTLIGGVLSARGRAALRAAFGDRVTVLLPD